MCHHAFLPCRYPRCSQHRLRRELPGPEVGCRVFLSQPEEYSDRRGSSEIHHRRSGHTCAKRAAKATRSSATDAPCRQASTRWPRRQPPSPLAPAPVRVCEQVCLVTLASSTSLGMESAARPCRFLDYPCPSACPPRRFGLSGSAS